MHISGAGRNSPKDTDEANRDGNHKSLPQWPLNMEPDGQTHDTYATHFGHPVEKTTSKTPSGAASNCLCRLFRDSSRRMGAPNTPCMISTHGPGPRRGPNILVKGSPSTNSTRATGETPMRATPPSPSHAAAAEGNMHSKPAIAAQRIAMLYRVAGRRTLRRRSLSH